MSEWLSTGQMISKLKVGDIAEGSTHWEVTKLKDGRIVELNSGDAFGLDNSFLTETWRIYPKYVSFSEAMKGVENGKDAVCYFNDRKITIESRNNKVSAICEGAACSAGGAASILIAWIVAGKWIIKE